MSGKRKAADAPWHAVRYEPLVATAGVQARFLVTFSEGATSWDLDQQHKDDTGRPRLLRNVELARLLRKIEEANGMDDNGGVVEEARITRMWGNFYGIKGYDGATRPVARLIKILADKTFKPIISPMTAAATAEMAKAVMDVPSGKAMTSLNTFRDRYQGLVEPLRRLGGNDRDVWTIVAQFDEWITALTDQVHHADGAAALRPGQTLAEVVTKSASSGGRLRTLTERLEPSPMVDLNRFQRLSNELQDLCTEVGINKGSREELKEVVHKTGYFDRLDRFLKIVAGKRFDEALHGLVVATVIRDGDRMMLYGEKMTRALRRALSVVVEDPPWEHPVTKLEAPLLDGDPPPRDTHHLKMEYFEKGWHDRVLVKLRQQPKDEDDED